MGSPKTTKPPSPPLDSGDAEVLLKANYRNLARKVQAGKTLSVSEVNLLEAIKIGGEAEARTHAGDQSELARILGVCSKTIQRVVTSCEDALNISKRILARSISIRGSSDGVYWTIRSLGNWSPLTTVAYGNGKFIASGLGDCDLWEDSNCTDVYAESNGGIHWSYSLHAYDRRVQSITWGNGHFVGISGNWMLTSTDGVKWTFRTASAYGSLASVSSVNRMSVAVGWKGELLTSTLLK